MKNKLPTGIRGVDRELSGGLEPGSILAVIAQPATQSEALLQAMVERRPTLYLSTLRESTAVEHRLDGHCDELFVTDTLGEPTMDNELMREITGTRSHTTSVHDNDDALDAVYEAIDQVDREMNIIVDPVNPLEQTESRRSYREVLNKLQSTALETGGLGVLHCILPESAPPLRDTTLAISDVVFELELVSATNTLQYQLTIPKNRGGTTLLEEATVKFDSKVWIDDTRNI